MAGGGADGEVGDGVVGEHHRVSHQPSQAAKTRAANHAQDWSHLADQIVERDNLVMSDLTFILLRMKLAVGWRASLEMGSDSVVNLKPKQNAFHLAKRWGQET